MDPRERLMRDSVAAMRRDAPRRPVTPEDVTARWGTPAGFTGALGAKAVTRDAVRGSPRGAQVVWATQRDVTLSGSTLGLEELGLGPSGGSGRALRGHGATRSGTGGYAGGHHTEPGLLQPSTLSKISLPSGFVGRPWDGWQPDIPWEPGSLHGWDPDKKFTCQTSECVPIAPEFRRYYIESSCSDEFKEMLDMAWCLLRDNTDLIEDACNAHGYGGACAVNLADGSDGWLQVVLNCVDADDMVEDPDGDPLGIYAFLMHQTWNRAFLQEFRDKWDEAAAQTDPERRLKGTMCVAADLASLILHENLHFCLIANGDNSNADGVNNDGMGPDGGACEGWDSYQIENHFKYHLLRRLCLLGYWCCDWNDGANRSALLTDPMLNSCTWRTTSGRATCSFP